LFVPFAPAAVARPCDPAWARCICTFWHKQGCAYVKNQSHVKGAWLIFEAEVFPRLALPLVGSKFHHRHAHKRALFTQVIPAKAGIQANDLVVDTHKRSLFTQVIPAKAGIQVGDLVVYISTLPGLSEYAAITPHNHDFFYTPFSVIEDAGFRLSPERRIKRRFLFK
jgi:hypothetical protein